MQTTVLKIKWFLYKQQEKQHPILSFLIENLDDIWEIVKRILECML